MADQEKRCPIRLLSIEGDGTLHGPSRKVSISLLYEDHEGATWQLYIPATEVGGMVKFSDDESVVVVDKDWVPLCVIIRRDWQFPMAEPVKKPVKNVEPKTSMPTGKSHWGW